GVPALRHRRHHRRAGHPHRAALPDRLDAARPLDGFLVSGVRPVRIGVLGFFTADTAPVPAVARLAEARGVESLWAPAPTQLPVVFTSPPPAGFARPDAHH